MLQFCPLQALAVNEASTHTTRTIRLSLVAAKGEVAEEGEAAAVVEVHTLLLRALAPILTTGRAGE